MFYVAPAEGESKVADKEKKEKKIEAARALFDKHLPKVKDGTMTPTKFRAEIITGIMAQTGAPMNSAATMYQLVRSEKELAGELKNVDLKRTKAVKVAKAPKATRTITTGKGVKVPASKTVSKKATSKAPASKGGAVQSDPNGTWSVSDGNKTFVFTSRDRARTAKSKLGAGWTVAPPNTNKTPAAEASAN